MTALDRLASEVQGRAIFADGEEEMIALRGAIAVRWSIFVNRDFMIVSLVEQWVCGLDICVRDSQREKTGFCRGVIAVS